MRYDVPILNQGVSPICWVVSAAMIQKYWQQQAGGSFDTPLLTGGASPLDSCIPGSTSMTTCYQGMREAGFYVVDNPPTAPTSNYVNNLLTNNGPLMFTHQCQNFNYGPTRGRLANGVHAVVIAGIVNSTAYFNNPWGDKDVAIPTTDLIASMVQAIAAGYKPLAYAIASPMPTNVVS